MAVLTVPKTDLYKFIREALIYKRYHRNAEDFRYHGIPIRYEPTIFDEARKIFKKRGLINYLKNDQILIDRFVDQIDNDPSLGIFKQPETALAKEDPLQLEQEHTAWEKTVQAEQQVYAASIHAQSYQAPSPHGPSISTILSSAKEAPATGATVPETTIPGGISKAFENVPEHVLNPTITRPLTSRAGVFFQRNVGKYLTASRIATGISMGIGAIAGSILGPAGTFAGAGVGALMPSFIRSGGGRFLGNIGNGAINAGLGISNQISTGSLIKLPPKKFWAFIGIIFLLIGVGIFSAVFTPPGEEQPTAEAAPVGVSLGSCQFTRGDQNPPSAAYKSSTLLSYFQEAAAKSGIPAVVLAAVARVESPGIINQTNESLPSYGCPISPTGAKGLMQIQPSGTTGHSAAGVALGAQYIGIPIDQIDYCDIRQSIYLGAGVINSKRSGGKWDPSQNNNKSYIDSVAETYYGCLKYPSCTQGPYSYGDDLWASLQNCRTSDLAATQPPGFVYYCQGNIAWQQCSLSKAGCGPTSLAMVLSSFGINLTPPQVDQIFQDRGWRSCGDSPTRLVAVLQSSWLKDLGFEVGSSLISGSTLDPSVAKSFLDGGYLIIASSHNYPCANCTAVGRLVDHIFVVDAVDLSSNTVDIRDPNNCSYANGNDENQSNRVKSINSFAWLYAYPIKKVR